MKSEAEIQAEIRLAASRRGILLLRNNSGVAEILDPRTGRKRYVRYGLGNESAQTNKHRKSSDLIGITPIEITPAHVGLTLGVFTAVEVKHENWRYSGTGRESAQAAFLDLIKEYGGIGKFVTCEEDL